MPELSKAYKPAEHEDRIRARWDAARAFHADPARVASGERKPYGVLIPPPNVTAALHLGHALNNTLQDVQARAHRMMGFETLWMPGTDHAGIATQTVVEKRLLRDEKKRRTDYQRDEFVGKVQAFKDEYEAVITDQLKRMGCSCDWERQRFTMDDVCAKAVREAFFRLFKDGLIYRGKRLVNWDPVTQTVLADDEVEMEEVDGFFYYLRYPLVSVSHPSPTRRGQGDGSSALTWATLARHGYPGAADHPAEEQAFVTVATTRPETYLGDTAVALNPRDPRWPALQAAGAHVKLPFVGRVIPIVADDYVVMPAAMQNDPEAAAKDPKAAYATGFLKVTPAHDVNDAEIGKRHNLQAINVMAPDASISDQHGWTVVGDARRFIGMTREDARKAVVAAFRDLGLLEAQKPYRHSVGHSYRSHVPIEPYLSNQWYIAVKKQIPSLPERGLIPGTDVPVHSLAGLALAPLLDGALRFVPERYAKTYQTWLENLRDWPISRQLWWGHRIPMWKMRASGAVRWRHLVESLTMQSTSEVVAQASANRIAGVLDEIADALREFVRAAGVEGEIAYSRSITDNALFVCSREGAGESIWDGFLDSIIRMRPVVPGVPSAPPATDADIPQDARAAAMTLKGLVSNDIEDHQDPDVLDTWFSSGIWPVSTMGWPEPGQSPQTAGMLAAFNPTDVLCTAREIITLWVSRMVMFNRYLLAKDGAPGPSPFKDVFIHAMIQDGEGRKMSKSLGNGVDPLDIIATHGADAMRFTLCHMTTQTQDVRMPVERDAASGKNTSPKFDLGRNFCNKLWNAARFAMSILEEGPAPSPAGRGQGEAAAVAPAGLSLADRWMLSRLAASVEAVTSAVRRYEYADYAQAVYDLLWRDFCDWYLEAIKPTVRESAAQRAVLRATLDTILRLLHPVAPFITEAIYERLREVGGGLGAVDGLTLGTHAGGLLCLTPWPEASPALRDERAEREFERLRGLTTAIREARAQQNVPPKRRITLHTGSADLLAAVAAGGGLVETLAGLERATTDPPPAGAPASVVTFEAGELRLSNLTDATDAGSERVRLSKKIEDLTKSIAALEARLNNPGYAQRAPANLVQQTRDQLAAQIAERDATRAALEGLPS